MASLAPADLSVPALIAGLLVTLLLIAGIVADAFLLALVIDRKVNWAGHVKRLRARPWQWHDGAYLLLVLGTLFATARRSWTAAASSFPTTRRGS
jgi:hypothetical protein